MTAEVLLVGSVPLDTAGEVFLRARFESAGAVMRGSSAAEMRQVLAADIAKWARLVHDHHITFDQP